MAEACIVKWASIDFEYNSSKEPNLNLVCCVLRTADSLEKFWLHKEEDKECLLVDLRTLNEQGYIFLAYAVTAEARSFLALNLDPLKFKWVDLYLEYRQLLNHNHRLQYGKQLIDGKVKTTKPPKNKWEMTEEELKRRNMSKPQYGMASAVFKLLDITIDTAFKQATRDLIISAPDKFTEDEQEQIMNYCADDTEHLWPLFQAMILEYKRLLGNKFSISQLFADMKVRAEYACRTATMEQLGYPIDYEMTKNFSDQVGKILFACQKDIIRQFPDNSPFYKFKRKEGLFTMHEAAVKTGIKKWLKTQPSKTKWMLTKGKDLSLSLDAFSRHFNFTHSYPEGHYFAQMLRYLKLKQSLNGFGVGGKTNFWDYVGSDNMVRPYMGIYTAQSSRSQPKASSFIPLKSAWMRCMIAPPKGYAMYSIDWRSQEFILAALLSGDENMIKAYETGDVYLAFGKDCKYIPQHATKQSHKKERDDCKPVILGLSYDMSEYGLAKDLSEKFGRPVSPEEALGWIKKHKRVYSKFWNYKERVQRDYKRNRSFRLPDGWTLWGDNANFRSVGNVPVQGMAACIMRKAVALAQDAGLKIVFTLHDAVYGIGKIKEVGENISVLADCMDKAFRFYFPDHVKPRAFAGLDGDIWSPELEEDHFDIKYMDGKYSMGVHQQSLYIDERGLDQYNYFKQFFEYTKEDYSEMQF